jgi:hypothetical protein
MRLTDPTGVGVARCQASRLVVELGFARGRRSLPTGSVGCRVGRWGWCR